MEGESRQRGRAQLALLPFSRYTLSVRTTELWLGETARPGRLELLSIPQTIH